MPQQIIKSLIAVGWNLSVISSHTGISVDKLRSGALKEKEFAKLLHCAELARIDVDDNNEDD